VTFPTARGMDAAGCAVTFTSNGQARGSLRWSRAKAFAANVLHDRSNAMAIELEHGEAAALAMIRPSSETVQDGDVQTDERRRWRLRSLSHGELSGERVRPALACTAPRRVWRR
jgi:hypothetical protein